MTLAQPRVLDVSAGYRTTWYPGHNANSTYLDIRETERPDVCADSTRLPFGDNVFALAYFDPPFVNLGANSRMVPKYGHWTTDQIYQTIGGTGRELARVVQPGGFLILKFGGRQIPLSRVLRLLSSWQPMFGQRAMRNATANTTWTVLHHK